MTINVIKFNVFHYLLYSKHMNTLTKNADQSGEKGWHVCKGGSLSSRDIHHNVKDEEATLPWTMNHERITNFMHPGFTSTVQTLQLPRAKHTSLTSTKKNTCAANFFHSWGILKNMFVYKVTFSKVHGCHCTLFKPLYSGVDVTNAQGMCLSALNV